MKTNAPILVSNPGPKLPSPQDNENSEGEQLSAMSSLAVHQLLLGGDVNVGGSLGHSNDISAVKITNDK